MDQFGQTGPDKSGYARDVRVIAGDLAAGRCATLALTHRMTKMQLVIIRLQDMDVKAQPSGFEGQQDWVFVAVVEHGAYWFKLDGSFLAPDYVASKLGLTRTDGETVAEFLTRVATVWRIKEAV